jgi:pyruvate,water dikinase
MHRSNVYWLDDSRCRDAARVGNKGAMLARLRQRGHPIPDGFCITTEALADGEAAWRDDMETALRRLSPPWVVRSSSTAEDSAGLAFPGLFTTVLDLPDVRTVREAIQTVHRSANGPAVAAYARHHHFAVESIRMAVLVQPLVIASAAGVAFSRDPVSGADRVLIEANYGLGETVVDGSVTPDAYAVEPDGSIGERRIGSKRQKVVATTATARVRRVETSELERGSSVLTDAQVHAIANLVRRLAAELTHAVDVEWALVGGDLLLLQARPITTGQTSSAAERTR